MSSVEVGTAVDKRCNSRQLSWWTEAVNDQFGSLKLQLSGRGQNPPRAPGKRAGRSDALNATSKSRRAGLNQDQEARRK